MGSFANSLHVKADDAERVARSITEILAERGWRPTDSLPDADALATAPSQLRAMHVSAPHNDWVSVLDTDLMGVHALAVSLAERLSTHAIFFLVDDSDSWGYMLANPAGIVTEFETADGQDDEFSDGGDFSDGEVVDVSEAAAKLQSLM